MQRNFSAPVLIVTTLVVACSSAAAIAHPGHDHAHWSSGPVHAWLLIGALAAVLTVAWTATWTVARQRRRRAVRQRSDLRAD